MMWLQCTHADGRQVWVNFANALTIEAYNVGAETPTLVQFGKEHKLVLKEPAAALLQRLQQKRG
jgi:hypothetical protein